MVAYGGGVVVEWGWGLYHAIPPAEHAGCDGVTLHQSHVVSKEDTPHERK